MADEFKTQIPKQHYYDTDYDNRNRFMCYYHQIKLIREFMPSKLLELGIGNKTVCNYLKHHGFNVVTCDHDLKLFPDVVADIRNLPFKSNSFDLILACEILEHVPWEDLPKILNEISRVVRKQVIISIPYSSFNFELILNLFFETDLHEENNRKWHKILKQFHVRIPYIFSIFKSSEDHRWEMGRKEYSIKVVRKLFQNRFKIIKEFHPVLDLYHYFFVLAKQKGK